MLVAEIVLLAFFSIPFWSTNVDAAAADGARHRCVRVVAEQFAWNVHYPGADGMFGRTDDHAGRPRQPARPRSRRPGGKDDITTINRLNLPGRQARRDHALEQGRDPQLRPAADAREAGRDSRASSSRCGSRRRQTGRWDIACSQLCGLAHFRMKAIYEIQTQDAYDAWLKEEAEFLENP